MKLLDIKVIFDNDGFSDIVFVEIRFLGVLIKKHCEILKG